MVKKLFRHEICYIFGGEISLGRMYYKGNV
jgi:hypothetical protein